MAQEKLKNKDGIFIELSEIKGLMGSISPKLDLWKQLDKKKSELEKLLLERQINA